MGVGKLSNGALGKLLQDLGLFWVIGKSYWAIL
jgi:hypothetical protein